MSSVKFESLMDISLQLQDSQWSKKIQNIYRDHQLTKLKNALETVRWNYILFTDIYTSDNKHITILHNSNNDKRELMKHLIRLIRIKFNNNFTVNVGKHNISIKNETREFILCDWTFGVLEF